MQPFGEALMVGRKRRRDEQPQDEPLPVPAGPEGEAGRIEESSDEDEHAHVHSGRHAEVQEQCDEERVQRSRSTTGAVLVIDPSQHQESIADLKAAMTESVQTPERVASLLMNQASALKEGLRLAGLERHILLGPPGVTRAADIIRENEAVGREDNSTRRTTLGSDKEVQEAIKKVVTSDVVRRHIARYASETAQGLQLWQALDQMEFYSILHTSSSTSLNPHIALLMQVR